MGANQHKQLTWTGRSSTHLDLVRGGPLRPSGRGLGRPLALANGDAPVPGSGSDVFKGLARGTISIDPNISPAESQQLLAPF